jgi:hypothetical protein
METQDIRDLLKSVQDAELNRAGQRQWRSWYRLRNALFEPSPQAESQETQASPWSGYLVTFGAVATVLLAVGLMTAFPLAHTNGPTYAQAQQDDLYTSTFYSAKARADVVWITGMDSAEAEETSNTP